MELKPFQDLEVGAVGFSRDSSLISRLIRRAIHFPWSHTFLVASKDPTPIVLDAQWKGIRLCPAWMALKNKEYEIWNPPADIPPRDLRGAIAMVEDLVCQPYGYGQLGGFLLQIMAERIGFEIKNPWEKWSVCSETVALYLVHLGRFKGQSPNPDPNEIRPDHLPKYLEKAGFIPPSSI